MIPLWSTVARRQSVELGETYQWDLSVNAVACLLVTLEGVQLQGDVGEDDTVSLAEVLGLLERIEVMYRGASVFSMSGFMAHGMAAVLGCGAPQLLRSQYDAGSRFTYTVPLYLGHEWAGEGSAFPASRRGELVLRVKIAGVAVKADPDNLALTVTQLELFDHAPKAWLKAVQGERTFSAVGEQDYDLAMGYDLVGFLLGFTTPEPELGAAPTVEAFKLFVDGVEQVWSEVWTHVLSGLTVGKGLFTDLLADGRFRENLAGAYAQGVESGRLLTVGGTVRRLVWVPTSLWRGRPYRLPTAGRGRVHLRFVAGQPDTVRVVPVEVVEVEGAGS